MALGYLEPRVSVGRSGRADRACVAQPRGAVRGAGDTGVKRWEGGPGSPASAPPLPVSLQSAGHGTAAQAVTAGEAWRAGGCGLPGAEQPLFGELVGPSPAFAFPRAGR